MRVRSLIPQSVLLGTLLLAACSDTEHASQKKAGDGGPNGDAQGSGGSAHSGGGSSLGGSTATGGGTSGGGKSAGGASAGGSTSSGGANGDAATGSGGKGGAGNTDAGGPCGELALCCPTSGIYQQSCERQVAAGMAAACTVVRGLFCNGTNLPEAGAGTACTALTACCNSLAASDPNRSSCNQIVALGFEATCTQLKATLCP